MKIAGIVFALVVALVASTAHAALEEVIDRDAANVSITRVAGAPVRVRVRGDLKEFADVHGRIFAASWNGTKVPNYKDLLGSHYADYQAAVRARRPSDLKHFVVRTPELTLDVTSLGRFLVGKVWLNRNVPRGVSIDALR